MAKPAVAAFLVLLAAACGFGTSGGGAPLGPPPADAAQSAPRPAPGLAWVVFGADTVVAEVASQPAERERGLMGRTEVPDGTGMLFVFPRSEELYVWMKDTAVPLDVAFLDDGHAIAAIKSLEPFDETLVDSEIATALVLEVPRGWFARRGIGVGAVAEVMFGPGLRVRE